MCFFTSMETRQSCIQDTMEYMRPSLSPTYYWGTFANFAKIASQNLPTLLIGSLNPFQHLESPNFSQCSELRRKKPVFFQVVESCLLLVKILFFRCHQKFHIHKARVPAWQEFLRYWKGWKCVMWEKPFSVEESSFRMALGRKAGWGERLKNLIHSIVFILGMAMRIYLPMRIVADICIIRHMSDIARYMRRIFRIGILSASACPSLVPLCQFPIVSQFSHPGFLCLQSSSFHVCSLPWANTIIFTIDFSKTRRVA